MKSFMLHSYKVIWFNIILMIILYLVNDLLFTVYGIWFFFCFFYIAFDFYFEFEEYLYRVLLFPVYLPIYLIFLIYRNEG